MFSEGDLVNVINPAGVPYYGIGGDYIRSMMENNPHTITTMYTEANNYISSGAASWSCHISGCPQNLFWPDFLLEPLYVNREPDWEV